MNRCQINFVNAEFAPDLSHQNIQIIVDAVLATDNLTSQQLNISFVDAKKSAQLHQEFFNIPGETDVMSFPDGSTDEESQLMHLGDLAVCVDVAKNIAAERHASYTDELSLYITHGLLHLLGYDDQCDEDRQEMWDLQRQYLSLVDISIEHKPG